VRFPPPHDEVALHGRIVGEDPVAPADLLAALTEPLTSVVRRDLGCDLETARDAAIDALFEYIAKPSIFSPDKGRLSTFIVQIAKRSAVDRLRARSAEELREQEFSAIVELRVVAPNEEMERSAEAEGLWQKIKQAVQDDRDRMALSLILDGERSTDALASALGIQGLPQLERQREVKRHRDRLMKVLERLGLRLQDERRT
jgi:RNA polymerase sigma-70 factor, ECF subfamily